MMMIMILIIDRYDNDHDNDCNHRYDDDSDWLIDLYLVIIPSMGSTVPRNPYLEVIGSTDYDR